VPTPAEITHLFTYHAPKGDQPERYASIRSAGGAFAALVAELTPVCPDQSVALRAIREAVMWANAAIACERCADE